MNDAESLQTSHSTEAQHSALSSSKWQMRFLSSVVQPKVPFVTRHVNGRDSCSLPIAEIVFFMTSSRDWTQCWAPPASFSALPAFLADCCTLDVSSFIAWVVFSISPNESQELSVHLDVGTWDLFLLTLSVNLPHPGSPRKAVQSMTAQDP